MSKKTVLIRPEMTILDCVSRYRETEGVFKRYDEKAGTCLCCNALFDSLRDIADKHGLDLDRFLEDVEMAARAGEESRD